MMDDYTPTDEEVFGAFVFALKKGYGFIGEPDEAKTLFNRYLSDRDAKAEAKGAALERARIVAMLDARGRSIPIFDVGYQLCEAAAAIERGDHVKGGSDV